MMQISRYGIKLSRLQKHQIEMVRNWRNAPEIRDYMEYRRHITPQMQERWFQSLHPLKDFYFVIEYHRQPVGLIHNSEIDWSAKTGNAGLFIWEKQMLGSFVPVLASLCMVDFFFRVCALQTLFAKVMAANKVAVAYNEKLGFRKAEDAAGKDFVKYALEKKNYLTCTKDLHEMAAAVGSKILEITIENDLLEKLDEAGALQKNLKSTADIKLLVQPVV